MKLLHNIYAVDFFPVAFFSQYDFFERFYFSAQTRLFFKRIRLLKSNQSLLVTSDVRNSFFICAKIRHLFAFRAR